MLDQIHYYSSQALVVSFFHHIKRSSQALKYMHNHPHHAGPNLPRGHLTLSTDLLIALCDITSQKIRTT